MTSPTTKPTGRHPAGRLLHISASPRGPESISLRIAQAYVDAHRATRPQDEVDHWNLWDGTLPAFGPAGASAKMTVFGGGEPGGEAAAAWRSAPRSSGSTPPTGCSSPCRCGTRMCPTSSSSSST